MFRQSHAKNAISLINLKQTFTITSIYMFIVQCINMSYILIQCGLTFHTYYFNVFVNEIRIHNNN